MKKIINETVLLLIPFKDYSKHKLSEYIRGYLGSGYRFDLYYYEPLKKIFSNVIVYDYPKNMIEKGIETSNREIINLVKKHRPKYVVWVSMYYEFLESVANSVRKEGAKVIGIFFDDEWRFDEYSKYWTPFLDYIVTDDVKALKKYKKMGVNAIYSVPCNGVSLDWTNAKKKYDVSFVGARKYNREEYVNEVEKKGIPIRLFGPGWKNKGGKYVSFKEMLNIFKTSKINLNFCMSKYNKLGWKGRIFQVCLAGGFLLTEYIPGIENYFKLDKEIVCFHNKKEMIKKIKYYLKHKKERQKIAHAGWKKATSKYSSFHMLLTIFNKIEKDVRRKDKKDGSYLKGLKMPIQIRKKFSNYYFHWAVALSMENYNTWKDFLKTSIYYNPSNIWAWCYYIIGYSPFFVRRMLSNLFRKRKMKMLAKILVGGY